METTEQIRRVLSKALEEEWEIFLEQVSQMTEGELEQLEEQVVKSSQAMGRKLMEGVLNSRLHERRPAARGERRACATAAGRTSQGTDHAGRPGARMSRPYSQCLHVEEAEEEKACTHAEARADALWGVQEQRTTAGVQRPISSLSARLTLEEAAETMCRSVPIGMSGRQALNLMGPVGEAWAAQEDRQVNAFQAEARQAWSQPCERQQQQKVIERLSIERDGVLARMRRGSVPMQKEERQRKGDVYRQIKAGAVFRAERGPKRSELAPGVSVDTPAQESVRDVAGRTAKGGFGWLL